MGKLGDLLVVTDKKFKVIESVRGTVTDLGAAQAAPAVAPVPSSKPATETSDDTSTHALLRGHFAVSLCRAHRIGSENGSAPCQDGLPCDKKTACLDLADKTLSYAKSLKSPQKPA